MRVGQVIKLKTLKSKTAAPQQVASLRFYFANSSVGFLAGEYDLASQLVTQGILLGLIRLDGSWYKYADYQWHGEPKMTAAMREDVGLQDQLSADVMATIGAGED